ncbi:hypothetical protein GCM10027517_16100 [Phycicoccus ginsengisoli]
MTPPTVLYADFSCPWSYLAHRRLELLGAPFELRAVEHDPWQARPSRTREDEFSCLREELDRLSWFLLPGEELPHLLRGFVPHTRAAVSGYAECYGAGVADLAAPLLFDGFWRHGLDLSDPVVVRLLLADAVESGTSPSDPLRRWGHCVDVTGGPMTSLAWRLVGAWRREWSGFDKEVVPLLVLGDGEVRHGVDAVEHLGRAVMAAGIDPATEPTRREPGPRPPLDGYGRPQVLYPTPA